MGFLIFLYRFGPLHTGWNIEHEDCKQKSNEISFNKKDGIELWRGVSVDRLKQRLHTLLLTCYLARFNFFGQQH